MTDYRKMSDFEINKAVAIALGAKQVDCYENGDRCAIYYELGGEAITVRRGQALLNEQFNPCNDPSDAWPIIVENEICIEFESDEVEGARQVWAEANIGHPACNGFQYFSDENPLRAAMICFLMMKDAEKC